MNIVCLDIDDCILPSNSNYFGKTDDALDILEINLKRLKMILDKYDMKVFITSSWYSMLTLNKFNEINMEDRGLTVSMEMKPYYKFENMAFAKLKFYLDGYVIGMSCGNRMTDIRTLVKEGHKLVVLDDWDLQEVCDESENSLFCYTTGLIDGQIGFKIDKFMKG